MSNVGQRCMIPSPGRYGIIPALSQTFLDPKKALKRLGGVSTINHPSYSVFHVEITSIIVMYRHQLVNYDINRLSILIFLILLPVSRVYMIGAFARFPCVETTPSLVYLIPSVIFIKSQLGSSSRCKILLETEYPFHNLDKQPRSARSIVFSIGTRAHQTLLHLQAGLIRKSKYTHIWSCNARYTEIPVGSIRVQVDLVGLTGCLQPCQAQLLRLGMGCSEPKESRTS